jgi:CHAD domain-containing protein
MPPDALRILRGIVRRAPLIEMTDLSTRRGRLVFQGSDSEQSEQDEPWGGIDDDVVTVHTGPRQGLRFRHVQVRFHRGEPQLVDAVLAQLTDQGARDGAPPDLAVALGFPPVAQPGLSDSGLGAKASFGELVTVTIADGLSRLLDRDYQLRIESDTPGPEAIHQARVATRRLRSNLKTFGSSLDPIWVAHRRADLRWLGEALGRVRDPHVLADRLTAGAREPQDSGQRDELIQQLRHDARLAATDLTKVMADNRYRDLLDHLHAAAVLPPFYNGPAAHDAAAVVAPELVTAQWRSVRRKVRKAGRHPSNAQLHEIRRRAKQLRYAAEAVAPVIGRPAERMARRAKRLQTILGDHHDAVVTEAWLRDQARRGDFAPAAIFQAGTVCVEERRQQQKLRRRWRPAYQRLRRPKVRAWPG